DADLRASRIDDRLSAHGADRVAVVVPAPGARGDADIAVQGVPGLGADDAVHADPGGGLQSAHGARGAAAEDAVDGDRGAAGVQARLERPHGGSPVALTELRMPH